MKVQYKLLFVLIVIIVILIFLQSNIAFGASLYFNDFSVDSKLVVDNDNLAPYVDFSFTKKKNFDIYFVLGPGTHSVSSVNSVINSTLSPILDSNDIRTNIIVTSSTIELNSVLPTLAWKGNSSRYLVYVNNGSYPELSDDQKLASVISNLDANYISFVGMGNVSNKNVIEKLISSNKGNGVYIDNSDINTAFTKLANYLTENIPVDLYFNVGISSITTDVLKNKIESIVKPKLIANNISANITVNNGVDKTLEGSKVAVCDGTNNALLLKPDGTLWFSTGNTNVTRIQGVPEIVDIACGSSTYFAVGKDGQVYAWGSLFNLGVDSPSYATTSIPMKVLGGATGDTYLSNIIAISSYGGETLALKSDGSLLHFGAIGYGVLSVPAYVTNVGGVGRLADIVAIETGVYQSFALSSTGNLYVWGTSFGGEVSSLGLGYDVYSETPVLLASGVKKIVSDRFLSAYQKTDNSIWVFGCTDESYWNAASQYHSGYEIPYPSCIYSGNGNGIKDIYASGDTIYYLTYDGKMVMIYHNYYGKTVGKYDMAYGQAINDIYSAYRWSYLSAIYIKNDGSVVFDDSYAGNTYDQLKSWGYNIDADTYLNTYCMGFRWKNKLVGGETGTPYFNISYTYEKELSDVYLNAPFRNVSDNYFIELSEYSNKGLSINTKLNTLAQNMKNDNLAFIGIGNSSNRAQFESLISAVDNNGTYNDISNIDAALNSLADYIIGRAMKPPALISDYLLVNEEVEAPTVFYSDIESDPYDSKWIYKHDPKNFLSSTGSKVPFDNSNGAFSLDGKVLSTPVSSFIDVDSNGSSIGKVGGYKVTFQAKDKPKGTDTRFDDYRRDSNIVTKYVNIHRKPIANYTASVTDTGTNYIINLSDNDLSYDLDHTSRADKGIANRVWGYAVLTTSGSISWNYTKTTNKQITYTLPKGQRYLVSLKVQDIDGTYGFGAWSDPVILILPGKPVAQFNPLPNPLPVNTVLSVNDSSYATMPGYTIVQRLWNITKVGNPSFSYVNQAGCKTSYLDSGVGEYIITLQVKDNGGSWSDPCVRHLLIVDNVAPTITAVPASRTWSNTDALVSLAAHDDGGSGLKRIDYVWTTDTSDTSAYSSVNISNSPVRYDYNVNTAQTANGKWYLCARALDHSDNYSNNGAFSIFGTYNIDKIAPNISADLSPGTYQDSVTTSMNATDAGGSGLKTIQYQWTNSSAKPSSGWSTINIASPEDNSKVTSSTIGTEGTWYLHMQVTDYAGNVTYQYRGPIIIQHLSITSVDINGYWNHWRGQVDIFGEKLTNEPHRFLSLECVKIDISTLGNPDRVTVRFSPELESMTYTDPKGHAYHYNEDFFGYDVQFPTDSTFTAAGNHVTWEYHLPLAPSTKDWKNNTLRQSYTMTVTAYKGDVTAQYVIHDIEITGNIYDLTYIQPKK